MAEVIVQNMRNPDQVITVMITLRRMSIATEKTGEVKWVLEASTKERDADGDLIPPAIKYLSNRDTLSADIQDLITELCEEVDWDYEPDYDPPEVISHWPLAGALDVSVETEIIINLAEVAPAAGIDLDSIKVRVKGYDLTDQVTIKGDIHSCSLTLTPGTKYQSAIDENFDWDSVPVGDLDD